MQICLDDKQVFGKSFGFEVLLLLEIGCQNFCLVFIIKKTKRETSDSNSVLIDCDAKKTRGHRIRQQWSRIFVLLIKFLFFLLYFISPRLVYQKPVLHAQTLQFSFPFYFNFSSSFYCAFFIFVLTAAKILCVPQKC